ncbi:MAG: cell division protein ZapE, partial [Salinisphaera sp.]|nr:cell division protein ZapE [Salinisphaera sp.]
TAPDELYAGGLQRQRFLPAIDAIHEHCHVLKLDDGIDYRLQMLQRAKIYHQPLDGQAEQRLAACFLDIAGGHSAPAATLTVLGRGIATRRLADGVVWFDFPALCEGARSVADYIEIARCFHTVLLAGIPVLSADDDNAARRLIHLVDELYDRNVKLIVSAAAPPEELYQGKKLAFAFQRTASRLHEMGSRGYLGSAHRP